MDRSGQSHRPALSLAIHRLPRARGAPTPLAVIELCAIAGFSFERGDGTLKTGASASVPFDVGVFRPGAFRPTADEARAIGSPASPVLPRVGEIVAVTWRADVVDVPESVTRIVPPAPRFTLTEWLGGVNERTDLLDGITAREVRRGAPFEPRRGRSYDATDAAWILKRVRDAEELFDEVPEPWVASVDANDRASWTALGELLSLEDVPDVGRLDFRSYLDALAEAADEEGIELRLFEISADADEHFVVALEPDQFEALEADGYVASPIARSPMPRGASSIAEARAWLSARVDPPPEHVEEAAPFDLVAASRRVFRSVCTERGFEVEIEPGPPDRFVMISKLPDDRPARVVFMFQEVEENGQRAHRYRFVDRDGESFDVIDDVARELDDRAGLERARFARVAELEAHLLVEQDDWTQTVAGLRLTHEALADEGIWLSTTETAGEDWIELTVAVTEDDVDAAAVLEAASISSVVAQRQGRSLELRATLPLSLVTGARLLDLVDLLVAERSCLLDELFGDDADGSPT